MLFPPSSILLAKASPVQRSHTSIEFDDEGIEGQIVSMPPPLRVRLDPGDPAEQDCDLPTLRKWIHQGRVKANSELWDPEGGRWVEARAYGPISSQFSQSLWDAWEASAGEEIDTSYSAEDPENPSELEAVPIGEEPQPGTVPEVSAADEPPGTPPESAVQQLEHVDLPAGRMRYPS